MEGGAHPGWGTGNWVVPLGRSYLELVRIADPALAGESPFGRRALDALAAGGGPYAWCVAPADFDATAARLGLAVSEGTRRRPDGTVLAWRTAGLETALGDPSRPFFIDWRIRPEDHPGRTPVRHRAGDVGLRRLELAGDEVALRSWLGDEAALVDLVGARATSDPAVLVRPGPPAVSAIAIDAADGPILLESRDWRGR